MKKLSLMLGIVLLFGCNQQNLDKLSEEKVVEIAQPINFKPEVVRGKNAPFILEKQQEIRANLNRIAKKILTLSRDVDFVNVVASPFLNNKLVHNYHVNLGEALTSETLKKQLASFEIEGQEFEVRLTISFIGKQQNLGKNYLYKATDIAPRYIVISQLYSPGLIPAWKVENGNLKFEMLNGNDIYNENIWFVGITPKNKNKSGGESTIIGAQGERCICMIAVSGGCSEPATFNPHGAVSCGTTNSNCECPHGCP